MIKEVTPETTLSAAEAFGRVNLIGEHTDYNGGWVLPTAIPQKTSLRLIPRSDRKVIAKTTATSYQTETYLLGEERPRNSWIDYIQGATFLLAQAGHPVQGFEIEVHSTVPTGSGLSSSAALEISLLKALRQAWGLALTDVEIARLGQRIENEFVGAKVGIMDQMACAFANFGEALFLDTKELHFQRVSLPLEKMDLVVINSGLTHQNSGGDYNQRRAECEKACAALGIQELREMDEKDLPRLNALPEVLQRRARHVITENARVHRAVQALQNGDIATLGELFYASHASMRDDYEVSIPEIDLLVELCQGHPATLGARLTGGGFGGSIVAITEKDQGAAMATAISQLYTGKTGHPATVLVP